MMRELARKLRELAGRCANALMLRVAWLLGGKGTRSAIARYVREHRLTDSDESAALRGLCEAMDHDLTSLRSRQRGK